MFGRGCAPATWLSDRDAAVPANAPSPQQLGYCSRMEAAKARLFPVKPHPAIDLLDSRIR
jgi:hypothetical protein